MADERDGGVKPVSFVGYVGLLWGGGALPVSIRPASQRASTALRITLSLPSLL
jgi:hypothetical protein